MTLPQRLESVFKRLAEVEPDKFEYFKKYGVTIFRAWSKAGESHLKEYHLERPLSSDDCDEIAGLLGMEIEDLRCFDGSNRRNVAVWRFEETWKVRVVLSKIKTTKLYARREGLYNAVEIFIYEKGQKR